MPDVEHDEAARADSRIVVGERRARAPPTLPEQRLAAADAQAREHGEEQHDDPDAADPGGELAPHRHRARQRVDVGRATLEPVVEKPDIDSNSASTGLASCGSASRYGIAPKMAISSQISDDDDVALARADALPAVGQRSTPEPEGEGHAPATRNGHTGSP